MENIIPEEFKSYFKIKNEDVIFFGAYKGGRNLIKGFLLILALFLIGIFMPVEGENEIPWLFIFIMLGLCALFFTFLYLFGNNEVILDKKAKELTLHWRKKPQKDKTHSWNDVGIQYVRAAGNTSIHLLQIYQKAPRKEIFSFAPENRRPEVYPLMEFIEDFMEGNPIKEQYFKKE